MKLRGKVFSLATREAHRRHQLLLRELPLHEKIMYRMDRILRERDVRSYRGWSVRGPFCAVLNFDHGRIEISPFGDLEWKRRRTQPAFWLVNYDPEEFPVNVHNTLHAVFGE